jgi:hypothetical protein
MNSFCATTITCTLQLRLMGDSQTLLNFVTLKTQHSEQPMTLCTHVSIQCNLNCFVCYTCYSSLIQTNVSYVLTCVCTCSELWAECGWDF